MSDPDPTEDGNPDEHTSPEDGNPDEPNQTTESSSLVGETWEKLAIASGILGLISVLFLPIITVNVPEFAQSAAPGTAEEALSGDITLGDLQSYLAIAADASDSLGASSDTSSQITFVKTALDIIFYSIVGGSALLVAGGIKRRAYAAIGAVLLTLPAALLAFLVIIFIPGYIEQQAGAVGGAIARELISTGTGTWGLIIASLGGIISATGRV